MLKTGLTLLKMMDDYQGSSYLIGGFVRDYLLGRESNDIDIATSLTPRELKKIFPDLDCSFEEYGSVSVIIKNIRFEITTFRKEHDYQSYRKPVDLEYVKTLEEDVLRRDFTINAIAMDKDGNVIDLLDGKKDLENRVIRTIGDSKIRFREDALRILRAIRFAVTLDFRLDENVEKAIIECRDLLKELSYDRRRQELDKIFTCGNTKKAISLLLRLGLDEPLELKHLNQVDIEDDLLGIWAILDVGNLYPFSAHERKQIKKLQEVFSMNPIDPIVLYDYGLYLAAIAASRKGINREKITMEYAKLPIHQRKEINISVDEIIKCKNIKDKSLLKEAYRDLESKILKGNLENEQDKIISYLKG